MTVMNKLRVILGVVAIFALAYFLGVKRTEIVDMSQLEAENAVLRYKGDSLQNVVNLLQAEITSHHAAIDSLQHLIIQNTSKINENRIEHEKEIVRIDNMPVNELFRFFTDYLAR